MYADHHQRTLYRIPEFAGNGTHDWRRSVRWHIAGRRMEPAADDSYDQHQHPSWRVAAHAGAVDSRYRFRHLPGNEQVLVDRRQTLQLPVRMRNWMGDQAWQARAHAEKSFVFRHHDRVLELHGCDLFAR